MRELVIWGSIIWEVGNGFGMACLIVLGCEQFPGAFREKLGMSHAHGKLNHKCLTLFRFQCLLHACFFLPDAVLIFVPREFCVHCYTCPQDGQIHKWPLVEMLFLGLLSVVPGGEAQKNFLFKSLLFSLCIPSFKCVNST